MKLTHLYAVCACALLSLGAVNADNAYAQKAPAKKEAVRLIKRTRPGRSYRGRGESRCDYGDPAAAENSSGGYESSQKKHSAAPMDNLRDQTLDRMILERIIEQKARDTGIRIDDNMLNGAIEQIATNNGLTVPQLEKKLATDGISVPSFKSEIRGELLTPASS